MQLSWSFTSLELAKSMQKRGCYSLCFVFFQIRPHFAFFPLNLKKSYPFFMAKDEQLHLKFRRKACILVIVFTGKASNCLAIKPYYIFYKGNMKMHKVWLNIYLLVKVYIFKSLQNAKIILPLEREVAFSFLVFKLSSFSCFRI